MAPETKLTINRRKFFFRPKKNTRLIISIKEQHTWVSLKHKFVSRIDRLNWDGKHLLYGSFHGRFTVKIFFSTKHFFLPFYFENNRHVFFFQCDTWKFRDIIFLSLALGKIFFFHQLTVKAVLNIKCLRVVTACELARCNARDRFYELITPTVFIFPFQNFACILKKLQQRFSNKKTGKKLVPNFKKIQLFIKMYYIVITKK